MKRTFPDCAEVFAVVFNYIAFTRRADYTVVELCSIGGRMVLVDEFEGNDMDSATDYLENACVQIVRNIADDDNWHVVMSFDRDEGDYVCIYDGANKFMWEFDNDSNGLGVCGFRRRTI